MAQDTDSYRLPLGTKVVPSEEFVRYCETEFEKRQNSGDYFDEDGYREAMEMVTAKLRLLEAEILA
jgi:hypothetical protein